jgi:VWFA-related protein
MPGTAFAYRILAVCLLVAAGAGGQSDIKIDVDLVRVPCVVTDRTVKPVQDLHKEDFVLKENGAEQPIKYFWQEADLPLTIGLIVDVSGSQGELVRSHRDRVAQFIRTVVGDQDRGFIATVGLQARILTKLDSSRAELLGAIDHIDRYEGEVLGEPCRGRGVHRIRHMGIPLCGGTALWNGLYYASWLGMKPATGRKALVVITDGMDTGSDKSLHDAIEAAQETDTMVYTIRYVSKIAWAVPGMQLGILSGRNHLHKISDETGGREFHGSDSELDNIFHTIEDELRMQYVLGYTPAGKSDKHQFRKIKVTVKRPHCRNPRLRRWWRSPKTRSCFATTCASLRKSASDRKCARWTKKASSSPN